MNIIKRPGMRLLRPADLLLPISLLAASLLGRGEAALGLYVACFATKICALATADGLRAAFATQPSIRYVQGSALVALIAQLPGAALAALLCQLIPAARPLLPLTPCGMLLNIEHVFYEYLYASGDKNSATASRCVTAVLTLLGILLCMPPHHGAFEMIPVNAAWPLITCGLSALIGFFISMALGGSIHPRLNDEVLRCAPMSMLQAALCPALTLLALALLWPANFTPAPFFTGLAFYEALRTPFRRSPLESRDMNRLLLIVSGMALVGLITFRFLIRTPFSDAVAMTCAALLIAALCVFGLYGSVSRRH